MDLLLERERDKYRTVWGDAGYRVVSPGVRHLSAAVEWMRPEAGASITDWGCGTGLAAQELSDRGFAVRLVDIARNAYLGELPFVEACLWRLPEDLEPTEYGFCADVMEHIPPDRVEDVLAGIAACTKRKAFFQIALFHDTHFTRAGPLHLSVCPPEWWMDKLARHFVNAEFRKIRTKHLLAVVER